MDDYIVHIMMQDYQCYYEECQQRFTSKYNLARHINTVHLEIRDFKCNECFKRLSSKASLREHRNSHLKIKDLKCRFEGCNLSFGRASLLCMHHKLHFKNSEVPRSYKKYEQRKPKISLPEVSESRACEQIGRKVHFHFSLLN